MPRELKQNALLLKATKIRLFETKLLELSADKLISGTVHTCIGQELIPVVLMRYVSLKDYIFSNHRCHGHYLSIFDDYEGLANELISSSDGVCHGVGGSQHLHKENFYSSGIQGSMLGISLGVAFSLKEQKNKDIAISFIGDGTLGQGSVYEVFNIASKWNLPLLIVIEDNHYAQSTSQGQTLAGSIEERCKSFDIKYIKTNSNDINGLDLSSKIAVDYVRETCKPCVIHVDTYRLSPHSKGDDFRDKEEIQLNLEKDRLEKYVQSLDRKIIEELKNTINQVFKKSVSSYGKTFIAEDEKIFTVKTENSFRGHSTGIVRKDINNSLINIFTSNQELVMWGEDVEDPYGGAFKITQGLSLKFPKRIINTPISEGTIVAMGIGRALMGKSTMVEIMFSDFLSLAYDQILNSASKLITMFGEKKILPLIIRCANGPNNGYGPTHSQDVSVHFFGIPFVDLYMPSKYTNFDDFFLALIKKQKNTALVFENKNLYSEMNNSLKESLVGFYELMVLGESPSLNYNIRPRSKELDLTIICSPLCLNELELAMEMLILEEISVDVFISDDLKRYSWDNIEYSIKKSKKLLIIDGASVRGSWSTYVWYQLSRNLRFFGEILSSPAGIIPAGAINEYNFFPNAKSIAEKAREIYERN